MIHTKYIAVASLFAVALTAGDKGEKLSPAEEYARDARTRGVFTSSSPGSLWSPNAPLVDMGRDFRARFVDDLVTIIVSDRASAIAAGNTKSSRSSSAKASVGAIGGITRATGPLSRLADLSSESQLDGQGTTSRQTVLTTTVSARVTEVLPNGYLLVEGAKQVQLNSENQLVTIRGIVRPVDLLPGNQVDSNRLAQLEVRINGKGVVGDAIRRPFILYRILLGILPF